MTVRIDHNVARTAQQIPLTVTVNHTPMYSGVVDAGIAGMEPQDFLNLVGKISNDNSSLHYIIYVNQKLSFNFTDIMIGDTFNTKMRRLINQALE